MMERQLNKFISLQDDFSPSGCYLLLMELMCCSLLHLFFSRESLSFP